MSEYIAEYDEFVDADGHAYFMLSSGRKEEITRCRDCKYMYRSDTEGWMFCPLVGVHDDGFCAWGVRRDA